LWSSQTKQQAEAVVQIIATIITILVDSNKQKSMLYQYIWQELTWSAPDIFFFAAIKEKTKYISMG